MKPAKNLRSLRSFAQTILVRAFVGVAVFGSSLVATPMFAQQSTTPEGKTVPTVASLKSEERVSEEQAELVQKRTIAIAPENTQYTYVPAQINKSDLRAYLQYPQEALATGKEGQVDVIAYLNADGQIMSLNFFGEAQTTENVFVAAAFNAVKKCRFTPAFRDNKPVNSVVKIPIRFVQ
jgi:TonB family protein